MTDQERTALLAWLDEQIEASKQAMANCKHLNYWYGETHWDGCREAYEEVKAHLQAESEAANDDHA